MTEDYALGLNVSSQTFWPACQTFDKKLSLHLRSHPLNQTSILPYLTKSNWVPTKKSFSRVRKSSSQVLSKIGYWKVLELQPTWVFYSIWFSFSSPETPQNGGSCFWYTHSKPTSFDCRISSCFFDHGMVSAKKCYMQLWRILLRKYMTLSCWSCYCVVQARQIIFWTSLSAWVIWNRPSQELHGLLGPNKWGALLRGA